MSYDTRFYGAFNLSRQLTLDEMRELLELTEKEHIKPSKFCQWHPDDNGKLLMASGEGFYNYVEWLEVIIQQYLVIWGVHLSGEVFWQGEDLFDIGLICVVNDTVLVGKFERNEFKDLLRRKTTPSGGKHV